MAYWSSHVSDQPPYTEYWFRSPARHLPIPSPSAYAALAPLLLSNSLHAHRGIMLEMVCCLSNQFSACHTGPGCLRDPLPILSPLACATVAHLFPSSSLPRTRKDSARDAGFPSSSLPRTRKDGTRDAGFLSPPTRTTHDARTCTLMLNNSVALSASACQVSLH